MMNLNTLLLLAQTTRSLMRAEALFDKIFEGNSLASWIVLLIGAGAGLLFGRLVRYIFLSIGQRMISRGRVFGHTLCVSAASPANLLAITIGLSIGLSAISFTESWARYSAQGLKFLFDLSLAWFAYNLIDLVDLAFRHLNDRTETVLDGQIVPLIRKTLRFFLVVMFALFVAKNIFDQDINAWLAGLGIAGLAVSLAAQESIKNLFGSITIFMDRPFALGDTIVFGSNTGTVEEIGFRSTRVRTSEGNLITIPNSKIVDNELNNISRRPYIRRVINVTITYDTPLPKIEQAVQIIEDIFAEPDIAAGFDLTKYPPRVFFDELNSDSLNIKVFYWFVVPNDNWAYLAHAQKFNLRLIESFNEAGIEFAFPTRTLFLAGDPNRDLSLRMLPSAPISSDA